MKPELSEVRAAALLLPSEDREELLEELAASLDGVEPELTEEMVAELERRQASIRAGDYVDIETFLSSGCWPSDSLVIHRPMPTTLRARRSA